MSGTTGGSRSSLQALSTKRWEKWRDSPANTKQSCLRRKLQKEARLRGTRLGVEELLAAGVRPKRDDKKDPWKALTHNERRGIMLRSKLHLDNQLTYGIALDMIYGPWTVLKGSASWDIQISNSTVR